MPSNKRIAILTGGELDTLQAKMAHGVMRYRNDIAVVIDAKHAGGNVKIIVPYVDKDIPVVADFSGASAYELEELLVGVAPPGGQLPPDWIGIIIQALQAGIRVISGLHHKLNEMDQLLRYAQPGQMIDLRYAGRYEEVAKGQAGALNNNVILTVGSDCASGKMTTALELYNASLDRGLRADFIPTGQTGMYIAGKGFAIDAVVSDFMAGAIEHFVCQSATEHDFIFVEGQGSILHPAYSGVTLGLLHGSAPNLIVFAHDVSRPKLAYYDKSIPALEEQIELVERLANYQRGCRVLGISLFAKDLHPEEVREMIYQMELKHRIPVFAPLVFGCDKFIDILEEYR
ncbi:MULTISPECIES: DUF1611 domain-containing protein [Paenibacillus]|uniref:DUF1611 domain-containing protein n=1 Tax=Paenibacillus borealis TaxID=160799 RepID=A0ABX3H3S8_PAEBO|nr:DUF1611 domain-containing protein [Paenibacillus borealis]OMD45069.1 hypothetical protein BSK56_20985 [Paenibacillus borealis]